MQDLIEKEIKRIDLELKKLGFKEHDALINIDILEAQRAILKKVLDDSNRRIRIAPLKDTKEMWDMGLLTPEEYQAKIKEINEL